MNDGAITLSVTTLISTVKHVIEYTSNKKLAVKEICKCLLGNNMSYIHSSSEWFGTLSELSQYPLKCLNSHSIITVCALIKSIHNCSQWFGLPGELHMEYSAGWERGYVISSIDVGDVQMQCLLPLHILLYSGHSSERIGERERERERERPHGHM